VSATQATADTHASIRQAAARVLLESATLDAAVAEILRAISTDLDWPLALYWIAGPDDGALRCRSIWASEAFKRADVVEASPVESSEEAPDSDAGVEPDIWKIEGLDRRDDCAKMVAAARRGGRDKVSCIILGRGEDDKKVHEWLATAAEVEGFIGFAVGRTDFWEPLVSYRAKKITREAAVAEIARRYQEFAGIFEMARPA